MTNITWDDLDKNVQEFFNGLAEKNQPILLFANHIFTKGCPSCKYKPKTWAEFLFHYESAHGVPHDILTEELIKLNEEYAKK